MKKKKRPNTLLKKKKCSWSHINRTFNESSVSFFNRLWKFKKNVKMYIFLFGKEWTVILEHLEKKERHVDWQQPSVKTKDLMETAEMDETRGLVKFSAEGRPILLQLLPLLRRADSVHELFGFTHSLLWSHSCATDWIGCRETQSENRWRRWDIFLSSYHFFFTRSLFLSQ